MTTRRPDRRSLPTPPSPKRATSDEPERDEDFGIIVSNWQEATDRSLISSIMVRRWGTDPRVGPYLWRPSHLAPIRHLPVERVAGGYEPGGRTVTLPAINLATEESYP